MTSKIHAMIWRAAPGDQRTIAFERFRKRLFVDDLGWALAVRDGRESDQFDTPDSVCCALLDGCEIVAGFRAIRADFPYLAESVFPGLATLRPYPRRATHWEISRFGVLRREGDLQVGQALYSAMFRFALRRQAAALVAIADLAHERYLATLGIRTIRYGDPAAIGFDRMGRPIEAVAGEIPLLGQGHHRFLSLLKIANAMEFNDETLVLGSDAIPA